MALKSNTNVLIEQLIDKGPKQIDLTDEKHAHAVLNGAEQLLDLGLSLEEIDQLEQEFLNKNEEIFTYILLVFKVVRSKLVVSRYNDPLLISVVFAVYKEHNRIRKRSEHPHGEDFLVKKVEQLKWLFGEKPNINWKLIVVDDGCPDGSGKIAQNIIDQEHLKEHVRVLFLQDAINEGLDSARSLSSAKESQKGGSIVYGMWDAVQNFGKENHVVAFTDADLSTHLGQLGLLLDPILIDQKLAAIGSRREVDSVVIKKGSRNNRGKLFIYLWKRLIPNLSAIVDTQCGFKAFKAEIISDIISGLIEKKFAFDIELLLRTSLIRESSIDKVGIAWIDSEEASTTTDLSPYLPMLKSIVKMYEKYLQANPESDEFASFIRSLSEEEFSVLLEHIPLGILEREPLEFSDYRLVTVDDLQAGISE